MNIRRKFQLLDYLKNLTRCTIVILEYEGKEGFYCLIPHFIVNSNLSCIDASMKITYVEIH